MSYLFDLHYLCRMYSHLDCIALRTIKLSDSKNLLSAWSRQLGRITFSFPAGQGREARRRRALCPPLAIFSGVSDIKPGREVLSLRDLSAAPGTIAISSSPAKNLSAMFLAEVLDILLRHSDSADAALSDFLFGSVEALGALTDPTAIANFHIIFLYRLSHFAGIEPQLEGWNTHAIFDLREGRFRTSLPFHRDFLQGRENTMLMAISRADYRNAHRLPLSRDDRRRALDVILQYFSFHLTPVGNLHSLEILRELGS